MRNAHFLRENNFIRYAHTNLIKTLYDTLYREEETVIDIIPHTNFILDIFPDGEEKFHALVAVTLWSFLTDM